MILKEYCELSDRPDPTIFKFVPSKDQPLGFRENNLLVLNKNHFDKISHSSDFWAYLDLGLDVLNRGGYNLRALATRAASPGDLLVPRAGSPGDINVPRAGSPGDLLYLRADCLGDLLVLRAGCPGDINVRRAGSPGDINVLRAGSPRYKKVPRALPALGTFIYWGCQP